MQLKAGRSIKSQAHPSIPSIPSFQAVRPTGALALTTPTPPNRTPILHFGYKSCRESWPPEKPNQPQRYRLDPAEQELPFQALGAESPARGREPSEGPFFPGKGCGMRRSPGAAPGGGSHGQLGAVGAQPVLVEAAAHAPPQRVGAAVRLVPEICGEPAVSTDTRTRGEGRTDTRKDLLEANQSSSWRTGAGSGPGASAGKDGRAPTTRPSDRLILVGSGRCWDQGMLLGEWTLTTATPTPIGCFDVFHAPSDARAGGCSHGSCGTPWVRPHQDGFRIPTAH